MAERIETVSFDLDTTGAVASINKYVAELNKLDAELQQLQKEGKDTAAVQKQIATTTAQMNKALQQTTTTAKGATGQMIALSNAEQKLATQTKVLSNTQQKAASSFARSVGSAKSLTSAFTRGAGALSNLVGGFGLSAAAIGVVANAATGLITNLQEMFIQSAAVAEIQASVEEATKGVITEYVSEARSLNSLLAPLGDANTSSKDRKVLIDEIQSRYPQYLDNINLETVNSKNLASVQAILNQRLIEGIVLKAKQAEQEKIIAKIVELSIAQQRIQKRVTDETAATIGDFLGGLAGVATIGKEAATGLNAADEELRKINTDLQIAELEEQQKSLDKTFAGVEKTLKGLNINLGTTNEAEELLAKNSFKADKETKALKGSLADLEEQLSKINKELTENTNITDKQRINELGAEYIALSDKIAKARKAIDAATKAQNQSIAAGFAAVKGLKDLEDRRLREVRALKAGTEQLELQKQLDLNRIEAERQRNLKATNNAKAEAIINAAAAKKREETERNADAAILQSRIAVQQKLREIAVSNREETAGIDQEIANLEAALLKLTENDFSVKIKIDAKTRKKTIEDLKETVKEVAGYVETFSGQVFDFLQSQNEQAIQTADAAISRQKEVLNALLANEEQTNVEQVRLEQERLEKLNAEREKAKEREARIVQAQIAINLALAVARAVVEGGGIAAGVTVGLALTAALIGFVKAKQASEQAFFGGTLYAKRGKGEKAGRDTIKARINEGEAVIPTATNKAYHPAIEAIYNRAIPAQAINAFVENYGQSISDADKLRQQNAGATLASFDILQLAAALRSPAPAPEKRDNAEMTTALELLIAEFRKGRSAGDGKRRSEADVRGKIRSRLGVRKTR